jgi:hypothetical protein
MSRNLEALSGEGKGGRTAPVRTRSSRHAEGLTEKGFCGLVSYLK